MSSEAKESNVIPLLVPQAGRREFLLGNEAIVRGAIEAGVGLVSGYPGTPSSEITDWFSRLAPKLGIPFEYSVNEKVAIEMAFAASMAGARSLVAMKHLGLMYAGDPMVTIPYIGTDGGMVIVSAGDPSCLTSPNEQDQRQVASMLFTPMLDPSTAQEALEMTRFAFELSEACHLPVILRPMTRLCHTRADVEFGAIQHRLATGFKKDPKRKIPLPAHARLLRLEIKERIAKARKLLGESPFFPVVGEGSTLIISAGVPTATTSDILEEHGVTDQVRHLHIGGVYPLPEELILDEIRTAERIVIVEELLPFLEDAVHVLCSRYGLQKEILGKYTGHFERQYEYLPEIIQKGLHEAIGIVPAPAEPGPIVETPVRPPVLCSSCPHRGAFFAARAALGEDVLFFNDIGCYTLGFGGALDSADALLAMGSGITLAAGVARIEGKRTVGFIGDSTFFHSGIPPLVNAIKEKDDIIVVIMDNEVTAMTGFQDSPSIEAANGRIGRDIDILEVVRSLSCKHVERVDPNDLEATVAAFQRAKDNEGPSVLITERACPVYSNRLGSEFADSQPHQSEKAREATTYVIDHTRCQHCGREEYGHRCSQMPVVPFERSMARARSLETGPVADRVPVEVSPCAGACPLYLCIQGYSAHIAAGNYELALELIMEQNPLPDSVCRVCHAPCEVACIRSGIDEPVAINDLKRFVVDWANEQPEWPYNPPMQKTSGKRVAVVGAGPAGLAAAHDLQMRGHQVTLLDSRQKPGGLLRYGIPSYRLPADILDRDVNRILDTGVEFQGETRLGTDITVAALRADFDRVCLAIGNGIGLRLALEGSGPTLTDAIDYLSAVERGKGQELTGKQVLIIGGGNSAIDAARSALRNGAESVTLACLEDDAEMPAIRSEIQEAQEEGIEFLLRTRAIHLAEDGIQLEGVRPIAEGPFRVDNFESVPESARLLKVDQVINAIGQIPDESAFQNVLSFETVGVQVEIDPDSCATSVEGVYACGDMAPGHATVTDAIAQGLRAAWAIDGSLRGEEAASFKQPPPRIENKPQCERPGIQRRETEARQRPTELTGEARIRTFDEVRAPLSESQARAEAARCMICGQCGNCRSCLDLFGCPAFLLVNGRIELDPQLCTACGVCAQFCPNGAILPETGYENPGAMA